MDIGVLEVIRKMRLDGWQKKEENQINNKMQIECYCIYFTLHSSEKRKNKRGVFFTPLILPLHLKVLKQLD